MLSFVSEAERLASSHNLATTSSWVTPVFLRAGSLDGWAVAFCFALPVAFVFSI
jgi:hypothetical protein